MGYFRLYGLFATFVYSQLQAILPDPVLGSVSNWDHFLNLDLGDDKLVYKTRAEFLQNPDFADLVKQSKLPTPSRFVDQCLAFYRSFCESLLSHDLKESDLIRGLSCFDPSVILDAPESHYRDCINRLVCFFADSGWISSTTKDVIISQYRSFIMKLREDRAEVDDWFCYLSGGYEMRCRPELHLVFKYACLCLSNEVKQPKLFSADFPGLKSNSTEVESCVRSLQLAFVQMPNVSSLFSSTENVSSLFPLFRQGPNMLSDKKFSAWNLTKSIISRRLSIYSQLEGRYIQSSSREEKAMLAHSSDAGSSSSGAPSNVAAKGSSSTPASLPLARATLSVSRVTADPGFLNTSEEVVGKMGKKSKKSPQKK